MPLDLHPARSAVEDWDYVVVGAGAAGCVLAERLSAGGRRRVLVLEAGGNDSKLWVRVPAGFTRTIFDARIGWGYANQPSAATANRVIPCPRGRLLGGSSSINGHLYVRGQAADYAEWETLVGEGWGWDALRPYFERAEGRLEITDPRMRHPICEAFVESLAVLGVPRNPNYNSGKQEGGGYYRYLMKDGRRWSAADAYLRPALPRPNLLVRTGAHATRIVFEGRRARGVRYRLGGEEREARAGREVILAGGVINTPQLLQLSGVGDPALLQQHGIATVHAAPGVGEHLSDHYAVRIAARVRGAGSLNERARGARLLLEVLDYVMRRRGLLASAVAHAFGFVRASPDAARPDVQLLFTPASYAAGRVGQAELERLPGMTCGVMQLRPKSRGYVRICSPDPLAAPEIQPNFLADPRDVAELVAGMRFVRRLYAAAPLARYVQSETLPGAALTDDAALEGFARTTGSTVYHPVGSCRMGHDPAAPLDAELRVKGLAALRVVDASAMPSMVSGNTYAATMMLAEKGADLVLAA